MPSTTQALIDRFDAAILRYDDARRPLLRGGLGATILLAGAHKLVAPGAWHASLADPLLALWPTALLPLDPTFVLFGVSEVVFGVLLLADWHTPTVAALTVVDEMVDSGWYCSPALYRRIREKIEALDER